MKNIVGIDIGTTSICFLLFDYENRNIVSTKNIPNNSFLKPFFAFEKIQNVDVIINYIDETLKQIINDKTTAIGITGQMHGILYYNKEGKHVSNLFTWQDDRGNLLFKDGKSFAQFLGTYSGYGCATDFYNYWHDSVPKNAIGFCTIADYLVMHLTGNKEPLVHASNAASFGCFDLKTKSFSYEKAKNLKVIDNYSIAGTYRGIPVSIAIGDNQASALATLRNLSDLLINIGTGAQVSIMTKNIENKPNIEYRPFLDGYYLACGASLCGGKSYALLKNFYQIVLKYAGANDADVYEIMNSMLDNASSELTVDVKFDGTRTNKNVKGSISDITSTNFTPESLTKGFISGLAKELYDLSINFNAHIDGIVCSGNAIRNNHHLVKELEKRFMKKPQIPAFGEEACFGAIIFAMLSMGIINNLDEVHLLIRYRDED